MKGIIAIFLFIFSFQSIAQNTEISDFDLELYGKGFIELPTHMRMAEPDNKNTVRYIVDYRCPYCKTAHEFIKNWSLNLPSQYEFIYQVAYTGKEGDEAAAIVTNYVFAQDIEHSKKLKFMEHMYNYLPRTRNVREVGRLMKEAVGDIGLDPQAMISYSLDQANIDFIATQFKEQQTAGVAQTPSIIVGGKLYTHYGFAKSDPKKWIMIMNALVSRHMYMEKEPKTLQVAEQEAQKK
jgi:hypothetical protein